jgi:hypothetical protein
MLDRSTTLKRWDELTRRRPVVALAAHDAHGGIGRGVEESGARKRTLGHVPSYEASFRTFSDNVILDAPLSGDAATDGRRLLDAIRHGSVFTVIDAIATPGYVDLRGSQGQFAAASNMGAVLPRRLSVVNVHVTLPAASKLVVVSEGIDANESTRPVFTVGMEPSGETSRVEVRVPGAPGDPPVPWLVSNPVYFLPPAPSPQPVAPAGETVALPNDLGWHIEKDSRTKATIETDGEHARMRYTLALGARASQFAALAGDLKDHSQTFRQVLFIGSASRPSRVSVQLRYADRGGERWGSSVYLDSTPREIAVPIDRMRPLDRQTGPVPDPAAASSLLLVVDLTNARPGDSNSFIVRNLRSAR